MKDSHARSLELWVLFALLHIPLALLMRNYGWTSTLMALLVGLIGILIALDHHNPHRVIILAGYLIGIEILWRMTQADVGMQYCKYLLATVFFLAIITQRPAVPLHWALIYFVLLLPSAVLTNINGAPGEAWPQIDFNLSGPLVLAAGLWFFSNKKIDRELAQHFSLAALAGLVGIMTLMVRVILTTKSIVFLNFDSNIQVTGGYSPNEVALILGLGALLCFLYLLLLRPSKLVGVYLVSMLIVLLTLSALTFSRGGIYLFAAGVFAALVLSLRDLHTRRLALLILALVGAAAVIILPGLAIYTNNAILSRFKETDTSGRAEAGQAEIALWLANPILGVGPGMGDEARGQATNLYTGSLRSHNELTRMLAEHGLPGLASLAILLAIGWKILRRPGPNGARAWTAALVVWVFGSLIYTAFRSAAPAVILGIASASVGFAANTSAGRSLQTNLSSFPLRWGLSQMKVPENE